MQFIDLTGHKYGRLTVLRRAETNSKRVHWHCRCDCGTERAFQAGLMRGGHTKSCGCWNIESAVKRATSHGLSSHPLHKVWKGMLSRCSNPNLRQWDDYGGRGIKVSAEWHDFTTFYDDMAPTYESGLTLERIDNSLGYSKKNCTWIRKSEQSRNRRNCVWVETDRGRMIMADAVRASGLSECAIRNRMLRGCLPDRILDKRWWRPDAKSTS